MKKIKLLTSVLIVLSLAFVVINMINKLNDVNAVTSNTQNNVNVYASPTTNPFGNKIDVIKNINFTNGTYDWIENDDWDWDTLALSYHPTNEANPKMEIIPIGANNHSSFEFWVPFTSLANVKGFMFYVDYSNLIDSSNIRMYFRFSTSTGTPTGNIGELTIRYLNAGVDCYYYDYLQGDWKITKTESDSFFPLPDSYKGFVYIPITNYNDVHTNGVGNSNLFIQLYHFDMSASNNVECAAPIYLDEVQLVNESTSHSHEFAFNAKINPTCLQNGLDLYKCSCGQVKWENVVDKSAHSVGEKHYCSDSLSTAICKTCNSLVYYEEESSLRWDNGVKVTYHYNHKDIDSVTYEYPKGYKLNKNDVPWKFQIKEGNNQWQFFRFTEDVAGLYGQNPIGLELSEDTELYAQYNNCHAVQKFRAMISIVSFNGGPYDEQTYKEQVIFVGQSNFSLWHQMESWYANKGVPVRNNSIAGATSHQYVEFVEETVLMYNPKIVVCIVSSNDLAYHQMSEKTVMNNMITFYEKINEHLPNTEVIFVSGNPLPGRNEYFKVIDRINTKLENFCNSKDNLHYVDIYDITMGYVLQYPVGWDTWTHLEHSRLEYVMGDKIYEVMKEVIDNKGISFR